MSGVAQRRDIGKQLGREKGARENDTANSRRMATGWCFERRGLPPTLLHCGLLTAAEASYLAQAVYLLDMREDYAWFASQHALSMPQQQLSLGKFPLKSLKCVWVGGAAPSPRMNQLVGNVSLVIKIGLMVHQ